MRFGFSYYIDVEGKKVDIENSTVARLSGFQNFEIRFLAVYLNIQESGSLCGKYGDPSEESWKPTKNLQEKNEEFEVTFDFGNRERIQLSNIGDFVSELCSGKNMTVYVHKNSVKYCDIQSPD